MGKREICSVIRAEKGRLTGYAEALLVSGAAEIRKEALVRAALALEQRVYNSILKQVPQITENDTIELDGKSYHIHVKHGRITITEYPPGIATRLFARQNTY